MLRLFLCIAATTFAGCGQLRDDRRTFQKDLPPTLTCDVALNGQWITDLPEQLDQRGYDLIIRLLEDLRVRPMQPSTEHKIAASHSMRCRGTSREGKAIEVRLEFFEPNDWVQVSHLGDFSMPDELWNAFHEYFKDVHATL